MSVLTAVRQNVTRARVRRVVTGAWNRLLDQALQIVLPIAVMLALWHLLALYLNDPGTLPTPLTVFEQTYTLWTTEDHLGRTAADHLQVTFFRAIVASTVGLVIAVSCGIWMTTSDRVEESLSTVLPFAMTVPTVVIILLSLIWFDFTQTGIIFAVIVASTPFGIVNMWEGAQDVNVDLVTMAHSFDFSTWMIWRHIYIPHLLPYLFGSYRYILGMVWKIVVLGEVFGMQTGFGSMFRYHFQLGNIDVVLAYLMLFVVIVLAIEYGVLKPLEDRFFRWRD